jgi:hypothetical protein
MKKTYVIIIVSFLLLSISIGYINDNTNYENLSSKLKYEISLDKNVYIEGEDIYLTLKITNISNKIDSIYDWNHYARENLEITNEQGTSAHYNLITSHSVRFIKYLILYPNEPVIEYINISGHFEFKQNKNISFLSHYFESGDYHIIGKLRFNDEDIISNELRFSVIMPPDSEKIPFTKRNEIGTCEDLSFFNNEFKQKGYSLVDSAITFLLNYPKSVYVFPIYDFYLGRSSINAYRSNEKLTLLTNIIGTHPERVESYIKLKLIIYISETKSDGYRILDSLKTAVNNPKLSDAIDKIIKEKQK